MSETNQAAERLRALERSGVPLSEDEQHHAEGDCELCAAERRAAYGEGMADGRLVESAACKIKVSNERRATVERMLAHYGLPGTEDSIADVYRTMGLDEETAR